MGRHLPVHGKHRCVLPRSKSAMRNFMLYPPHATDTSIAHDADGRFVLGLTALAW